MTSTFRLSHVPVTSEADTTRDFEELQTLLSEGLTAANLKAEAVTEAKLSKAVQEKLNPSAWTALTLVAALEFNAAGYEPAVRTEQGAANARLRGIIKVKVAKEVVAGGELFTLAAAFRPTKTVILTSAVLTVPSSTYLSVPATGIVTCASTLKAGEQLALDGLTYSLT